MELLGINRVSRFYQRARQRDGPECRWPIVRDTEMLCQLSKRTHACDEVGKGGKYDEYSQRLVWRDNRNETQGYLLGRYHLAPLFFVLFFCRLDYVIYIVVVSTTKSGGRKFLFSGDKCFIANTKWFW